MNIDKSSRAHLRRAKALIESGEPEKYFYAALELRMGIEARIKHYLEASDHISKSMKKGWQVAILGRNLDKAFVDSKRIIRWEVGSVDTKVTQLILYYTPVPDSLRAAGEKLGNYLHSSDKIYDIEWWRNFHDLLCEAYEGLRICNLGTLLGPPLIEKESGRFSLNVEMLEDFDQKFIDQHLLGKNVQITHSYIERLPNEFDEITHYSREAANHSLQARRP